MHVRQRTQARHPGTWIPERIVNPGLFLLRLA
jgi:hypothetical protein